MAPRPPVRPIICRNCGDEIVIVAQYLPTGPLCADCAPPDHPTQIPQITPNEEHGRRATASPEDGHPKENAAHASGFGSALTDRHSALAEATAFARAEAKRLKAVGPYGYKPAREIPEVWHENGTKPSVDESAHDPRPSTGATAQAAEAPGAAGEAHGA